jgi:hypothetical protein
MKTPFAVCAAVIAATLSAGTVRAEPRPVVLELYTSEGCSSCPPAESFVAELAQRPDVLPLSFHVDYWNSGGWRDLFTFADATHRQHIYADNLRESSVYTPQAVIDGTRSFIGSDRRSILANLSQAREGLATRITLTGSQVNVSVAAQPGQNGRRLVDWLLAPSDFAYRTRREFRSHTARVQHRPLAVAVGKIHGCRARLQCPLEFAAS